MKPIGWRGESYRHYLAAKGVRSQSHKNAGYFMVRPVPRKSFPQIEIRQVEQAFGREAADEARRLVREEGYTAKEVVDQFNLPYLRKPKFGVLPQGREELEGVPIVIRGEFGHRAAIDSSESVSAGRAVENTLDQEGRAEYRRLIGALRTQEGVEERRVEGIQEDMTRGAGILGGAAGYSVLQQRLLSANEELRRVKERKDLAEESARMGRYDVFVSPVRRAEIEDRILRAPKREAAILDAREIPVEPVELSLATSWPRQDRSKQLRVSKFFVKKQAGVDNA